MLNSDLFHNSISQSELHCMGPICEIEALYDMPRHLPGNPDSPSGKGAYLLIR